MCLIFYFPAFGQPGQTLSLTHAHELSRQHSALEKNLGLLAKASFLRQESIDQSRLPSIQWKADARIQSEVVSLPEDIGIPLTIDLPLYNIRTYADVQYLLYDGGMTGALSDQEGLKSAVEHEKVEVELNKLPPQVNQTFMGVLFSRKKSDILAVTLKDLGLRKESMQAGVEHGVILQSEVDKIHVRELELLAEMERTQNESRALLAVLSRLTGEDLSENVQLDLPDLNGFSLGVPIQRPEQGLFEQQQRLIDSREDIIQASKRPKISAFASGGIGYPNPLNFFDNQLSPYAMGGVAFSWNLVDWGKANRDRQIMSIQMQMIENQREAFESGLQAMEGKYQEDIAGLENQIKRDREITELQHQILEQLSSQLEHGVITANEYLIQTNAELQARQQLQLHEIQLIQVKIQYLTQQGALE
ncbi:MAG: TolC family protein [Bacteroidota bacterium]